MMLSVNNELLNEKTGENTYFRLLLRLAHRPSPLHRFVELILSCIQENLHLLEALTSIILLLTFILSYIGTMN